MWEEELKASEQAAKAAGKILKQMFGHAGRITKKGVIDLVTEADLKAESAILEVIRNRFPHDHVISEEAGGQREVTGRTWLIDPLDGTTNFAHGFPFFAVSIALEIEEDVILGIVCNPYLNEYFRAVKDGGAYLNGRPIKVSRTSKLEESLLVTGFPYDIRERPDRVIGLFRTMLLRSQGIRRAGSAAIDLCYVAAGRVDGFWEEGLKPWDTAAGTIVLKEAGGTVTNFEGEPFSPYQHSVVAANPVIHGAMIEALNVPSG
jgi:myo-inositol-1(or 4)-monophosphatase